MDVKDIFLGGTCADSLWRDSLIPLLKRSFFNPVVEDWTQECQEEEIRQRENCKFCVYVITPRMIGFYSIAEVVDDSNKRPDKTIFCYLDNDEEDPGNEMGKIITFNKQQIKSLEATGKLVERNGGKFFRSLREIADYINLVV